MQAAEEHANWLDMLYSQGAYVLCVYISGLAVEALLRGFHARLSREFDSRHDLYEWARKSGFRDRVPAVEYERYSEGLSTIMQYWLNDHRYRSEAAMRAHYNRLGYYRGIKGDVLKEIARRIRIAAIDMVSLGRILWN